MADQLPAGALQLRWLGFSIVWHIGWLAVLALASDGPVMGRGAGPDRSGFLSAFFALVGTHGLHVGVGMIWILVLSVQLAANGLTAPVSSRLSRLGTFWHFLDIVWIAIFSVVYLPGLL